ncbi:MAG: hypothetical protein FJZ64_00235 [Chlamydiae bacterium]|nr:hypothetical protein [Chlamydiota bacterium]
MVNALFRVFTGGVLASAFLNSMKSSTLEGVEYSDSSQQAFVDRFTKIHGISKRVFLREIDSRFERKPVVFSTGNLCIGTPQILIPKHTPLSSAELNFACAHELGHLKGHHSLILTAIAIANFAVLAIPSIPIRFFFMSATASAISLIPLVFWMEKQADHFVRKNLPADVLKQSLLDEYKRINVRKAVLREEIA